jgi:hypothetical protein
MASRLSIVSDKSGQLPDAYTENDKPRRKWLQKPQSLSLAEPGVTRGIMGSTPGLTTGSSLLTPGFPPSTHDRTAHTGKDRLPLDHQATCGSP